MTTNDKSSKTPEKIISGIYNPQQSINSQPQKQEPLSMENAAILETNHIVDASNMVETPPLTAEIADDLPNDLCSTVKSAIHDLRLASKVFKRDALNTIANYLEIALNERSTLDIAQQTAVKDARIAELEERLDAFIESAKDEHMNQQGMAVLLADLTSERDALKSELATRPFKLIAEGDGSYTIAQADHPHVASYGKDIIEAVENFADALACYEERETNASEEITAAWNSRKGGV